MGKIKNYIEKKIDSLSEDIARKSTRGVAKEVSREMVSELAQRLEEIGKAEEADAILQKLGDLSFSYAVLTWDKTLQISRAQYFKLSHSARYRTIGKDLYKCDGEVFDILLDLGEQGFEVITRDKAGNGFDYFLRKRINEKLK